MDARADGGQHEAVAGPAGHELALQGVVVLDRRIDVVDEVGDRDVAVRQAGADGNGMSIAGIEAAAGHVDLEGNTHSGGGLGHHHGRDQRHRGGALRGQPELGERGVARVRLDAEPGDGGAGSVVGDLEHDPAGIEHTGSGIVFDGFNAHHARRRQRRVDIVDNVREAPVVGGCRARHYDGLRLQLGGTCGQPADREYGVRRQPADQRIDLAERGERLVRVQGDALAVVEVVEQVRTEVQCLGRVAEHDAESQLHVAFRVQDHVAGGDE